MPVTLQAAYDLYIAALKEDQASAAHLKTVRYRLLRFIEERADQDVKSVTRAELGNYFSGLRQTRADGTMAGYTSTHRAFWRWCKKEGLVEKSPAKKLKSYKYAPVKRTSAPVDDIQKVAAALPAFVAHRHNRPRDIRDALFVSLSLDCGARRGAMGQLRRADVERALERGRRAENGRMVYEVWINRGKTGAALLEFFDETAALFRQWFAVAPAGAEFVFVNEGGEPVHPCTLGLCFVRVCRFAGVPPFRAQAVRKRNVTDISRLTKNPEIAQRYAGHSSLETTLEHYKDKLEDEVREAAADLAARRRGDVDAHQVISKLFGVTQ
jgi:integrase